MATSKNLERVCAIVLIVSLLASVGLMYVKASGGETTGQTMGYESRLFDTSRVHTIDIVMDDWDGFLENCESEEYSACAVVIDGESYKNVAIRAKGNTSLSSVRSLGSSRYSFKVEFDHYDDTKTYHGLDKLNLNNLIFDNTMMKDYLTYRMMAEFGVDAPLCSFVYITVNGEDFGLYLAVEGVEDAFLERNYGGTGELYKPDSMSFGGGRGNGKGFDMDDVEFYGGEAQNDTAETSTGQTTSEQTRPTPPSGDGGTPPARPDGQQADVSGEMPELPDGEFPSMPDGEVPSMPEGVTFGGNGGPGGGMGSEDVKLQYIDDDPDSYANIFDNAKTDVSEADEQRLIASLKQLSAYEDLEDVLDTDEVLRYFVVHNFVVNGDSYTGSMIHNYYLYEKDGQLAMIPWDYNLAFGTFQSNDAGSAVNDDIDAVLSDRPMQAWIFSDETYTAEYHALFAEFLETVDIEAIIDEAYTLIAPYVEQDPTKFCTAEEFETGVAALRTFCQLRSEAVAAQLAGDETAVDASGLTLSDMGTMNNGQGGGASFDRRERGTSEEADETADGQTMPERPDDNGGFTPPDGMDGNFSPPDGSTPPEGGDSPAPDGAGGTSGWVWAAVSAAVLLAAIVFAVCYRKRK